MIRWLIPMLLAGCSVSNAQTTQMICGEGKEIRSALWSMHHEQERGGGLSDNGGLVQLFATKDGSTWTLLLTPPGGPTCLLGSGKDWFDYEAKVEGQPL